jgi:hypothetical protein
LNFNEFEKIDLNETRRIYLDRYYDKMMTQKLPSIYIQTATMTQDIVNIEFPRVCKKFQTKTSENEIIHFGNIFRPYHGYIECPANKKYPHFYHRLRTLIKKQDPDFKYSTITINKNVQCKPHKDKSNNGDTYIIALGEFTGGRLMIENKDPITIQYEFFKFNGAEHTHWNEDWEGDRYSIMYYQNREAEKVNL